MWTFQNLSFDCFFFQRKMRDLKIYNIFETRCIMSEGDRMYSTRRLSGNLLLHVSRLITHYLWTQLFSASGFSALSNTRKRKSVEDIHVKSKLMTSPFPSPEPPQSRPPRPCWITTQQQQPQIDRSPLCAHLCLNVSVSAFCKRMRVFSR